MSSILRALKRVEDESPRDVVIHSPAERIDSKEAIQKRARSAWNSYRLLPVLVFAFVIFLGLWVAFIRGPFWFKAPSSPPAPAKPLEREKPSVSTATPQKTIQQMPSVPSVKKPVSKSHSPVMPKTALSAGSQPVSPIPAPAEKPELASVGKKARPESHVKPETSPPSRRDIELSKLDQTGSRTPDRVEKPEVPSVGKKARAESYVKPETTPPPGSTPSDSPPPRRDIDLSKFKLEAIVWSQNPDSRFAVINGRIIRVGDAIEDMSLSLISRDHIELKSKDGVGKLGFREQ